MAKAKLQKLKPFFKKIKRTEQKNYKSDLFFVRITIGKETCRAPQTAMPLTNLHL